MGGHDFDRLPRRVYPRVPSPIAPPTSADPRPAGIIINITYTYASIGEIYGRPRARVARDERDGTGTNEDERLPAARSASRGQVI